VETFVALDVGGTFLKSALIRDGKVIKFWRRSGAPLKLGSDGSATLDPLVLVSAVRALLDETAALVRGRIEGILLTGQMHGVILVRDGMEPVTDIITWRDSLLSLKNQAEYRSVQLIQDSVSSDDLESFGRELRDGLPIATLYARRTRGLNIEGTEAYSLISFCSHALCDERNEHTIHPTDAAAFGVFDIRRNQWNLDVWSDLDLASINLPKVSQTIDMIGKSKTYNCPVFCAVGDQQASLYGAALKADELSVNIATGSQVSLLRPQWSSIGQIRPYFDGLYLNTITHLPAGRSLNVLVRMFADLCAVEEDEMWVLIKEKTWNTTHTDLIVSLNLFPVHGGESGEIINLSERNCTVGDIFRAAINSMTSSYLAASKLLALEETYDRVILSGGLVTRFPALQIALEHAFKPSEVSCFRGDDASLLGLARIGAAI